MRVSLGEGTALVNYGGQALATAQRRFVRSPAGQQALAHVGHATAAVLEPLRFQGGELLSVLEKIGPWGLVVGAMGFMADTLLPFLKEAGELWQTVHAEDRKAGPPFVVWPPSAPVYVKWQ